MNRQTFALLANLARLQAEAKTLRHGFLVSPVTPSLPLRGFLYLWTFTLPDQTATLSGLATAWKKLMHHRARDFPSFRGVRVFEPSPTERWHVHCLTVTRLDVNVLRQYSQKFGFGRINVKRIPADKAAYVTKYILKSHHFCGTEGRRMFAPFGFKGISPKNIISSDTWTDYVIRNTPQPSGQFCPWHLRADKALHFWLKSTASGSTSPNQIEKTT